MIHRTAANVTIDPKTGVGSWETVCGKVLGSVELQLSGDPKQVTCKRCAARRS